MAIVSSVSISNKPVNNTIENGKTHQLSVTVLPSDANQSVIWTPAPGNNAQASVDSTGKITALSAGTVIVQAVSIENENRYDKFALTVNPSVWGYFFKAGSGNDRMLLKVSRELQPNSSSQGNLSHVGIDITNNSGITQGTNIYCPVDGKVAFIQNWSDSGGNYIIILANEKTLDGKNIYIRLMHMVNPVASFSINNPISKGALVGQVGNSGESIVSGILYRNKQTTTEKSINGEWVVQSTKDHITGAHLHADVRNRYEITFTKLWK